MFNRQDGPALIVRISCARHRSGLIILGTKTSMGRTRTRRAPLEGTDVGGVGIRDSCIESSGIGLYDWHEDRISHRKVKERKGSTGFAIYARYIDKCTTTMINSNSTLASPSFPYAERLREEPRPDISVSHASMSARCIGDSWCPITSPIRF
jgi:hypothetical protein